MLRLTSGDPAVRNPAEALRLAQQAVDADRGNNPITLDVLSAVQYITGDIAAAHVR